MYFVEILDKVIKILCLNLYVEYYDNIIVSKHLIKQRSVNTVCYIMQLLRANYYCIGTYE